LTARLSDEDEDRKKVEAMTNNWFATHKQFSMIDFNATLNGMEERFRK